MAFPENELMKLGNEGLLRELTLGDEGGLCFSSNDYLALSRNPRVTAAAVRALEEHGAGAGGSRLMAGNLRVHQELETRLARLTGMESALVFGSGYLANLGVLTALGSRTGVIFSDRLNHSSINAGARASSGEVIRYRHLDCGHLRELLSRRTSSGKRIIVTESLFSMDGDIAPLRDLRNLADEFQCLLMVDEAHATGVYGGGGGICRELGVKPDILTGTLSKALASYGGFACCGASMREYLINRAPSFIYSTGLPPASAGAAAESVEIVLEDPSLGTGLLRLAEGFRKDLAALSSSVPDSASQIIPLVVGDPAAAMELSRSLFSRGIEVKAIRPPTVPPGTSRLRFSVTLAHTPADLSRAASETGALL